MRRSPFSPQIHQKYIYMCNNSYKHLLNTGRKPQTSQKDKKRSSEPGRTKERKGRKRKEETGLDLHLWWRN